MPDQDVGHPSSSMNVYEKIAGWALVRSFKKHDRAARRGSVNDAHESRHIIAQLHAGNTHDCTTACPLWIAAPLTVEELERG